MKGVYIDRNNANIRIRVGADVESYLYRDTPAEKFIKFLKRNDPVSFSVKSGTSELTFCSKIKDPDEFPDGYTGEEPTAPSQSNPTPTSPPPTAPPVHKDFVPANQIKPSAPTPHETSSYIPDDGTLVAMSTYSDGYWKAKFLKDIRVQKEIRAQACLNTATNIVSQWRDKDRISPNELGRIVMEIATDLQVYVHLSSHGDVDEPLEEWNKRMREQISPLRSEEDPSGDSISEDVPLTNEEASDKDKTPGVGIKIITNLGRTSGNFNGDNRTDMDMGEMDFAYDDYLSR